MEQVLGKMRDIIREGGNIVVLAGMNITYDMGLNGVNAEHLAYDIEQKYGYPNDEIVSSSFYTRRASLFYKYYKEVILLMIRSLRPSIMVYINCSSAVSSVQWLRVRFILYMIK